MNLNHDQLGDVAAKYLKSIGYKICLSNLWSAGTSEKPDCLAFNTSGKSFLVEAKMSRSDFLADKKKWQRINPDYGAGHYRAYITPPGLLKVEEIPYGWQLWEVSHGKRPIINVIKGMESYKEERINPWSGNKDVKKFKRLVSMDENEYRAFETATGADAESKFWMLTLLRRIEASGVNIQNFAASNELWIKK